MSALMLEAFAPLHVAEYFKGEFSQDGDDSGKKYIIKYKRNIKFINNISK